MAGRHEGRWSSRHDADGQRLWPKRDRRAVKAWDAWSSGTAAGTSGNIVGGALVNTATARADKVGESPVRLYSQEAPARSSVGVRQRAV